MKNIAYLPPKPTDPQHRVHFWLEKIVEDEAWQSAFTDAERTIWIAAANNYLLEVKRVAGGQALPQAYEIVIAMLGAGKTNRIEI